MIEIAKGKTKKYGQDKASELRINRDIPAHLTCRLIDENGDQAGIISVRSALIQAEELGLDLVEISPNADPIVCRIMDYGKYRYERQKKEKANKRNSKSNVLKEMKFRCRIGEGDYKTKRNHVERFLDDGSKVKITIMFRGREMTHPELGVDILNKLATDLEEKCSVTQPPKLEGRNMTMIIAPL